MAELRAAARRVASPAIGVLRAHPVAASLAVAGVVLLVGSFGGDWFALGVPLALALSYAWGAYASSARGGAPWLR